MNLFVFIKMCFCYDDFSERLEKRNDFFRCGIKKISHHKRKNDLHFPLENRWENRFLKRECDKKKLLLFKQKKIEVFIAGRESETRESFILHKKKYSGLCLHSVKVQVKQIFNLVTLSSFRTALGAPPTYIYLKPDIFPKKKNQISIQTAIFPTYNTNWWINTSIKAI